MACHTRPGQVLTYRLAYAHQAKRPPGALDGRLHSQENLERAAINMLGSRAIHHGGPATVGCLHCGLVQRLRQFQVKTPSEREHAAGTSDG